MLPIPNTPPAPVPSPRFSIALLLTGGAFALFLSVGVSVQVLNVAYGVWFTELLIFLGLPWVVISWVGNDPVRYAGARFSGVSSAAYGFLLGAVNFFGLIIPLQFASQSVAPEWMKEVFDSTQLFRNQTTVELVLLIAGVGIIAPFCEEFFFRGVLQQGLATRYRTSLSILITAIVFSAFHLDPVGFLARLELGVLFGVLFWRTGSIWPAVGAHAANNLVSTAVYFSIKDRVAPTEEPDPQAVLFLAAAGLLAMWWVIAAGRRFPALLTVREPAQEVALPRQARLGELLLPWIAAAVLSAGALWLIDFRGVKLNLHDARHPLPRLEETASPDRKKAREELDELRRQARSGEVPLDEYKARRAELSAAQSSR